ncbi:MAG: hypothetical protein AB1422_07360 [bacterium]
MILHIKFQKELREKTVNESKLWLALLCNSKHAKPEEVAWFLKELEEFGNIFASSILTLKGKR